MADPTTSTHDLVTPTPPPFDEAFMAAAGFLAGYSGTTLVGYKIDLRGWFAFCDTNDLPVLEARRPHIELYARSLEDGRYRTGKHEGRPYANPTIGRRISTVCCFYKWCAEEDVIVKNPAAHVRRPKTDSESTTLGLDRSELGAFLVQAGLSSPRDHALACLLGLNGLRNSEACSTDIERLAVERGHRTLSVRGKGGKWGLIPLAPRTARAIDLAVGDRCEGPILLRKDGQRLDRGASYRIVRRLAAASGLAHHISPHSLRHAFITAAFDAGVPMRDVQEGARHADPRTTMKYDRNRVSLDRHPAYVVATFIAGAAR